MNDLPAEPADFATVTALLRHFSWAPLDGSPGRYEVWGSATGDEVLLPINPENADYDRLLSAAQRTLTSKYGSAATEVLGALRTQINQLLDSTQWLKETRLEAGLISWEEGEGLFLAARAALVASAKSTRERRPYHGNASAHIGRRFLESSLMGQTEVGSFIINAYTPSNARFHLTKASEEVASSAPRKAETVSGRTILNTMTEAMSSIHSTLRSSRHKSSPEDFLELVDNGVSYELLKALVEITHGADSAVKVSQRDPNNLGRKVEFDFSPTDSPILARAATRFAEGSQAPRQVTFAGEVTLLSHSSTTAAHVVRIDMDGRKVRVRLNATEYKVAYDAHGDERWLSVRGKLEKDGNNYWINKPTEVKAVDAPPQVEQTPPLEL